MKPEQKNDPVLARALAALATIGALAGQHSDTTPRPSRPAKPDPMEITVADLESRFGRPHARLFHLIGHEVQTPLGRGKLLQVFSTRATVDCRRKNSQGEPQVEFVPAESIEVIQ